MAGPFVLIFVAGVAVFAIAYGVAFALNGLAATLVAGARLVMRRSPYYPAWGDDPNERVVILVGGLVGLPVGAWAVVWFISTTSGP